MALIDNKTNWTNYDVIDKCIDVSAQKAIIQMLKGDAIEQKIASDLLTAVKEKDLEGIYRVNQGVPALRARKIGKSWWNLIPKGEYIHCMVEPVDRSPLLALANWITADQVKVKQALIQGWLLLIGTSLLEKMTTYDFSMIDYRENNEYHHSHNLAGNSIMDASFSEATDTAQSKRIKGFFGILEFLVHFCYDPKYSNIFGPTAKKPQVNEMRWLRMHALLLLTNYVNSEDMNYWKGKQADYVFGKINSGDYRFAEMISTFHEHPNENWESRGLFNKTEKTIYSDYLSDGPGTTCGYICHWLLWRLGVNDVTINTNSKPNKTIKLINRSAQNLSYGIGYNIGNLQFKMNELNLWQNPKRITKACESLKLGDIVMIGTKKQVGTPLSFHEHVFVYLGKKETSKGTYWITAEAGQTIEMGNKNVQGARLKMRKVESIGKSYPRIEDGYFKYGEARYVIGVIPIEALKYQSIPDIRHYYQDALHEDPEYFRHFLCVPNTYEALINKPIYNHNSHKEITDPKLLLTPDDFENILKEALE